MSITELGSLDNAEAIVSVLGVCQTLGRPVMILETDDGVVFDVINDIYETVRWSISKFTLLSLTDDEWKTISELMGDSVFQEIQSRFK